ncbi:MAG: hypothetical protein ACLFU8_06215 [Anaerolineales bacterium]
MNRERVEVRTVGLYPADWQILGEQARRLAVTAGGRENVSASARAIVRQWGATGRMSPGHSERRQEVLADLKAETDTVTERGLSLYPSDWVIVEALAQQLHASGASPELSNSLALRVIIREWHLSPKGLEALADHDFTPGEVAALKQLASGLLSGWTVPIPCEVAADADADLEV